MVTTHHQPLNKAAVAVMRGPAQGEGRWAGGVGAVGDISWETARSEKAGPPDSKMDLHAGWSIEPG